MSDNTKKTQYIHCLHFFSKDSNLTLKNHISYPNCEAQKRAAKPGQSSMSRDGSIFVYNSDVLREQFTGLVIQRGLPFNHFDDEQTTRLFQKHLQPKYNHVCRTDFKRDAMKLWIAAKQAIIDDFLKLNTNVNLTTDVWSAPHGVPGSYICVTAHWIEPGLYNIYYTKYGNPTTTESSSGGVGSSSRVSHGNQVTTLLRRLKEHKNKMARSDPSLSSEYERYVHSDFVTHIQTTKFETFDVLGFWNAKEIMFPVLSRMSMDILSVQAASVASESAFSTSRRVLSIRRTRLTPASLETCMCSKDHLDAQERKQDKSTLETPVDFEEEILDVEEQANEAIPLSDEEIALDAASSEGSMSGPGSGGEKTEAEAN
nr:zinc finger BED domain-containing protein RICESLEEPER 2-like [Tanacetum cinerariifolium]